MLQPMFTAAKLFARYVPDTFHHLPPMREAIAGGKCKGNMVSKDFTFLAAVVVTVSAAVGEVYAAPEIGTHSHQR